MTTEAPRFEAAPTISPFPADAGMWDVLDHQERTALPMVNEDATRKLADRLNRGEETPDNYARNPSLYPATKENSL